MADPVARHMERVDAVIAERLRSDVALVNQIAQYIVSAGGKRIRPRLVLLFANALGFQGDHQYTLAATVEFIHTATLLHDDVVDESSLRRGRKTSNAVFGNAASVLVGDFLYSRAFQMMVSVKNLRVLDVLADATNVIAEGEVLQLMNMHDPDLAIDEYLRVIRSKTAKLFEASSRIGAILSSADAATEQACAHFGRALGTAFQLVDDLLDYDGDTLALERGSAEDKALIRHAIEHGETARLNEIVTVVRRTGALETARGVARAEADEAQRCLHVLPGSIYRDALLELCVRSVDRSS